MLQAQYNYPHKLQVRQVLQTCKAHHVKAAFCTRLLPLMALPGPAFFVTFYQVQQVTALSNHMKNTIQSPVCPHTWLTSWLLAELTAEGCSRFSAGSCQPPTSSPIKNVQEIKDDPSDTPWTCHHRGLSTSSYNEGFCL